MDGSVGPATRSGSLAPHPSTTSSGSGTSRAARRQRPRRGSPGRPGAGLLSRPAAAARIRWRTRGRHHPDHRPGRVAASSSSPARRGRSTQREVEATRAHGRALRRLALELPDDYRAACQRRLQASPPGTRAGKARRRAVGKGLSDLADQHGERYEDLYQQELEGARSEPGPIRRGRPPGSRDQLAIRSASFARTWPHQPGRPRPRPRPRMGPALSPRVRAVPSVRRCCSAKATRLPQLLSSWASPRKPSSAGGPAGVGSARPRCSRRARRRPRWLSGWAPPANRRELASPLARRRRGGVAVPHQPTASSSRQSAAADRAGAPSRASRPGVRR
jgi:hypothetical protein